jgi:hypothetical protein
MAARPVDLVAARTGHEGAMGSEDVGWHATREAGAVAWLQRRVAVEAACQPRRGGGAKPSRSRISTIW